MKTSFLGQPFFFWLIAAVTAILAAWPGLEGNIGLRETLMPAVISIIMASNLNLMIGFTGYVNFGNVVFFGLGGYFGVWLTTQMGWPLPLSALAGGCAVSVLALVFGLGILRLRGAYFALATIGVNEAVRVFVQNFDPWGNGTGMTLSFTAYQPLGGPRPALWAIYFMMLVVMAASLYLAWGIRRSKFGLGLFAIREDEDAAGVLGVPARRYKAMVYAASAFLPAMAGALYFFKNAVIDPEQAFDLSRSVEIIVMLMLGGQGRVTGALLGAFVYEELRGLLLTNETLSNFQLVIAGLLLLGIVQFVPGGLTGWLFDRWPKLKGWLE